MKPTALRMLLDSVEQMVTNDANQARALADAHATLTHIATAIGLQAPTSYEKLKAEVADLVAKSKVAAEDGERVMQIGRVLRTVMLDEMGSDVTYADPIALASDLRTIARDAVQYRIIDGRHGKGKKK